MFSMSISLDVILSKSSHFSQITAKIPSNVRGAPKRKEFEIKPILNYIKTSLNITSVSQVSSLV